MRTNNFKDLSKIIFCENKHPELFAFFLKEKGHTADSFKILPDNLKTSLKFSFFKKNNIM